MLPSQTPALLQQCRLHAPSGSRLMGIDLGTKTIGLGLSDIEWCIASPLETILRRKFTLDVVALKGVSETHNICGYVIGLPLEMNGKEGPRAQSVRSFIRQSAPLLERPFFVWDERLSTQAVTRTLLAADASRARRNVLVDKMAAAYILQGALDAVNRSF